jgi:hypothetical protein
MRKDLPAPHRSHARGGTLQGGLRPFRSSDGDAVQGYGAEAAHGLADRGLGLGAPRVHLFVDVHNTASQPTAVRAGFTRRGRSGGAWSTGSAPEVTRCLRAAGRRLTDRSGRARPAPSRPGQAGATASRGAVCAVRTGPAPFCGTSVSRIRP